MTSESKAENPELDERMMRRAFDRARGGVGRVSPGPLVGCVIVNDEGTVVGEGSYLFEDIKHAETLALELAGDRARGATAYISLEPHAHHGRTPPCTNALIEAGIRRVVAPIQDPNPKVSGRGFAHLRDAGLEVREDLLAAEGARLNEAYIHLLVTGRPFVHLKLAVSLDGKIATRTGDSRWIAGEDARLRGQEFRYRYDAILVGSGTVANDNPLLTDRSDQPRRRPLVRVVLDDRLRLTRESQLAQTARSAPVLLFTSSESDSANDLRQLGVEIVRTDGGARDLLAVLGELGSRGLQSVLVEGGGEIAGAFLDAGLVNKVTFFIAPMIIGGREAALAAAGTGARTIADAYQLDYVETMQRGRDIEITAYPRRAKAEG